MATKDYVKRPKAPAKKQAKRRNSSKSANTPTPWVKVFLSVVVVLSFVFALYKLQSLEDNTNSQLNQANETVSYEELSIENESPIEQANDSLEQAELPELPVLGEEEWEYIDSLPDFSVEVDAQGPLESDKDFIMQCGSFKTLDGAEELKAKIAFQGLESRILTSNGRNGLWYRVVLGPYERKRNAERHRHQLRNGNVNGCKIW